MPSILNGFQVSLTNMCIYVSKISYWILLNLEFCIFRLTKCKNILPVSHIFRKRYIFSSWITDIALFSPNRACLYGVLAWNLTMGSGALENPSYAPKIPPPKKLLGPQRNSQFRIPEIYDLTECCCSPRQTHNSGATQVFFRMPPFTGPPKSCCRPRQDQNFDICHMTSTIVTIKIIKNIRKIIKLGIPVFLPWVPICIFVQKHK